MDVSDSDEEPVGTVRPFDAWTILLLNESKGRKVHVPWLHRFELLVVIEDIYSSQFERQKRGYGKLLMWKARLPRLPVGIECTMGLLRVLLINEEVRRQLEKGETSIYGEHDLQLMLSSALTRSLNQLAFVTEGGSKSFASLENKMNIPRWIVNLRHEASHRAVLPSLSKLLLGAQFLFEWLYTNYWEETKSFSGWIVSQPRGSFITNPHLQTTFKEIFDVWQSVKMFEAAGYEDLPQCDESDTIDKTIRRKLGIELETKCVSEAVQVLSESLVSQIKGHFAESYSDSDEFDILCSILLGSDTFIPNEEVLNLSISYQKGIALKVPSEEQRKHNAIIEWMVNFWSFILQNLQNEYSFFPGLIQKLLLLLNSEKSSHRQLIIALWIKVICSSMELSSKYFNMCQKKRDRPKKRNGRARAKLNHAIKELERIKHIGFICNPRHTKGNYCTLDVLKYALLHPTEYTSLFLDNLMVVTTPIVPVSLRKQFIELVSLYLGKDLCEEHVPVNHHIHTVSELSWKSEKCSEMEHLSQSFWERASTQEWAECPLGVLPWQKGKLSTLDFPPQVTWQESTVLNHFNHSEFNDFDYRKDFDKTEKYLLEKCVVWNKQDKHKSKHKIPKWRVY